MIIGVPCHSFLSLLSSCSPHLTCHLSARVGLEVVVSAVYILQYGNLLIREVHPLMRGFAALLNVSGSLLAPPWDV